MIPQRFLTVSRRWLSPSLLQGTPGNCALADRAFPFQSACFYAASRCREPSRFSHWRRKHPLPLPQHLMFMAAVSDVRRDDCVCKVGTYTLRACFTSAGVSVHRLRAALEGVSRREKPPHPVSHQSVCSLNRTGKGTNAGAQLACGRQALPDTRDRL